MFGAVTDPVVRPVSVGLETAGFSSWPVYSSPVSVKLVTASTCGAVDASGCAAGLASGAVDASGCASGSASGSSPF